ncbi:MAG: YggS family pyridoxal phosphate-dependent enzyme [Candidatus Nitrospinota bacterium M3_3B_026]
MTTIADNIAEVRRRMTAAAARAGRGAAPVRLVAVTKNVDAARAAQAVEAGVEDLGESRVQEARAKSGVIGPGARWHMIGPLQTNKAKYCPGLFTLIHSVDRRELARELARRAEAAGTMLEALLQVNISGERRKSGCAPEEAEDILKSISGEAGLKIKGLMTIPPYSEDPEDSRPFYRALMELRGDLERLGIENVSLDTISAGMTGDFEVAVEEGSTLVRVGTAIFGERVYG